MADAIEGLKPEGVWKSFAEIAKIPRCSKHEAAISKYVMDTARRLGLEAKADAVGNVAVKKAASPGREKARRVCLQGHLDMVCEKNVDTVHNFSRDPIELVRRDNYLTARGTTLGADNGIAVATNLAIMADRSLEHGPLEFLFTVDEETGLTGANNLQAGFIESRTLINLDSEEEGSLFVGCSGGRDTVGTWALELEDAPSNTAAVQISIRGLKGGHSGLEIDKGHGNAIKILNRLLLRLNTLGARLSSISSGNKRNAIPREADALLFIPKKNLEPARATVEQVSAILKSENAAVDAGLAISLTELPGKKKGRVLRKPMQKRLLQTITAVPHGVVKMCADLPELVETSTNLAIVKTTRKTIEVATSQRSSVASEIDEIAEVVGTVLEMGGAVASSGQGYPGWKPDMDSEILKITRSAYASLFGREPEVKAIHAGLECGIIGEKYPGMDMVSFGPTLTGVHTPDEKIYIDTVERFWQLLLEILKRI
ncbi:MAG TPA: aminoacyl-histidine dipeptidase [Acidobacteriota bacterium]|nr:aminoacyl-histidine dipeptidase [Acidobacteriota bacterium]